MKRREELEERIERARRSKSTHIDISKRNITTLPESLGNLTNLIHLDLGDNNLDDLSVLQKLPNLEKLFFQGMYFPRRYWTKISEWQSVWLVDEKVWKLRHLLIKKIGIERIFNDLSSVPYPFKLDLNHQNLLVLPDNIGELVNLTSLYISNNKLNFLPDNFDRLINLQELDASHNKLTCLPDSISSLISLKSLRLHHNKITKLPKNIGKINKLEILILSYNELTEIPDSLGEMIRLSELYIQENQIKKLPNNIGSLVELWRLRTEGNQLAEIPDSLGNLIKLKILFINKNKITKLPDSMGNLTSLMKLYIQDNQIRKLPTSFANLSSLCRIDLYNNPLEDLLGLQPLHQLREVWVKPSRFRMMLPHRYRTKLNEWKPEWLLDEKNAEMRRWLIQSCGYERICQKLGAIELDTWKEYTLLKIDGEVDVEAMVLLKMTCPSTAHIHILRVPPEMTSAESAITWVNHGIHPDEFAIQT
jgi:leucine-rich repeat protein SHOC2